MKRSTSENTFVIRGGFEVATYAAAMLAFSFSFSLPRPVRVSKKPRSFLRSTIGTEARLIRLDFLQLSDTVVLEPAGALRKCGCGVEAESGLVECLMDMCVFTEVC